MATTPEGKIKKKLDRMLKSKDLWYFPPQAGPFGSSGIPDRIVCAGGYFIGIECKADATKKPTRLQAACMQRIEDHGGRCFVVYDDSTILRVEKYIDITLRGILNAGD